MICGSSNRSTDYLRVPHQITIIAADPLTDLALAAKLDPQFASLAKQLIFIGGGFNPMPADTPYAQENEPVDATNPTLMSRKLLQEVARGQAPFDQYLGRFGQVQLHGKLRHCLELARRRRSQPG